MEEEANQYFDEDECFKLLENYESFDDVDGDKCLSLTSLTQIFDQANPNESKHGKKNAMERKEKKKGTNVEDGEFDPFDFNTHMN